MAKKKAYCEQPKVSVIVPVYKVDKYLVACLNSIVNQTMEELEIIIVDEGEQDRCREIIDYFESVDSRVVAPHQKNGGYGASCNLGMQMARGEYLAIVESDDFIEPEMYEEMYTYAKELDADVVKAPYYEYYADGNRKVCKFRKFMQEKTPVNNVFSMKDFGELLQVHASLWSGIYRTSYMRKHNIKFIEAKGAGYVDVGFRIQSLINSERVAWLDKLYYNYRADNEDSSSNNFKMMPMLERWQEVHEFFASRQEEYDRYYGRYLILDEYLNSLGWASLIEVANDELSKMSSNLSYVKEEVIKNASSLTEEQKEELLEFKENPAATMEKLQQKARRRNRNVFSRYPADDRFTFPYADIPPLSKVIIYGGGVVGKTYLYQLGTTRYCEIIAVCDANPDQTGISEVPVLSPMQLSEWNQSSYDYVVIALEKEKLAESIKDNLQKAGISSKKIIWIDPAL